MLDEQEARALAALLERVAERTAGDGLDGDAGRMAAVLRERLGRVRAGGRDTTPPPGGPDATARHTGAGEDAAARDEAADRRDLAAGRRDEAGALRDAAAAERGAQAQRAQAAADDAERAFHDLLAAAEPRDRAAARRDRAADGTEAAARRDRLQARRDREASTEDRAAARADRRAARADRGRSAPLWPDAAYGGAPDGELGGALDGGLGGGLDGGLGGGLDGGLGGDPGGRESRLLAELRQTRARAQEVARLCEQAHRKGLRVHQDVVAALGRAAQLARRISEITHRREPGGAARLGPQGGDGGVKVGATMVSPPSRPGVPGPRVVRPPQECVGQDGPPDGYVM
ncbi:hypothetical protein [Bailinhaonella thermotolerans]|uniref:hypothetical protein n=1 Tax=Bailinhaonella thermotolerans TaxID=1070861 RepID=UPI00192A6225|nr:hypothetical protein [Bailinhaonella thermotolerans]